MYKVSSFRFQVDPIGGRCVRGQGSRVTCQVSADDRHQSMIDNRPNCGGMAREDSRQDESVTVFVSRHRFFQNHFRMPRSHAQQHPRRARRLAPPLFPVVQCLYGNAKQLRKLILGQA